MASDTREVTAPKTRETSTRGLEAYVAEEDGVQVIAICEGSVRQSQRLEVLMGLFLYFNFPEQRG